MVDFLPLIPVPYASYCMRLDAFTLLIGREVLAWNAADSRSKLRPQILALRGAPLVLSVTDLHLAVGHLRSAV
ncbi:hypothetical protein HAX54_017323, partial [Datura stramonium]|nr:hypothetical protein [Datura stramonium]